MTTAVYLHTHARNPATGAVLMTGNQWRASTSPMVEVVAMALRTQRGACLVDPELGVDWSAIRKLGAGAVATAKAAITKALARHVRAGEITNVLVECEADVARGLLVYSVKFIDPRLSRRVTIRNAQVVA